MRVQDRADRTIVALRTANRSVAIAVGAGLCLCTLFILAEIAKRGLGGSLGGTDEIAGYTMAIATSWAMGWCLIELGHVRIDVLRTRLGAHGRSLADLVAMASLATVVTIIAWHCWPVVARSLQNGSRANTPLETPLVLVQIPWFAGWIWFALTAWLTLGAAAAMVLAGRIEAAEAVQGVVAEADAAAREAEKAA